jgi:hypothetical protein
MEKRSERNFLSVTTSVTVRLAHSDSKQKQRPARKMGGSGSFHQQTKKLKKNPLFCDFKMTCYLNKADPDQKTKKFIKTLISTVLCLESGDVPYQNVADPEHWVRVEVNRIVRLEIIPCFFRTKS